MHPEVRQKGPGSCPKCGITLEPLTITPPPTSVEYTCGYYNFDVNDAATGAKYGMLSVNGSSGQIWYHTWHGDFVQGKELN